MTYHVYKTDCYQASRVLMQSNWESESIFIHRPRYKIQDKDQYLDFWGILKLAIREKKESSIVFHSQSSLPYLVVFFLALRILFRNNFLIVYDVHDLHEKSKEYDSLKVGKYEIMRYYLLGFLENLICNIKSIKIITVSKGLSKIMAEKYGINEPVVVRNISLTNCGGALLTKSRYDKVILFFGTTERVPLEIIPKLHEVGIKLHLFGRGITENWLRGLIPNKYLDAVKVFGEYSPDKLEFLDYYSVLLIHAPNNLSLNFKHSLPNKFFQALERGVSVLVSRNFMEMLEVFDGVPGAVGILNEDDILMSIKQLLCARSPTYNVDIQREISFLESKSMHLYLSAIGAIE